MTSVNYRSLFLYKASLQFSYRHRYRERYLTVSRLIPEGVRVVDYCCGDAELYTSHLRHRDVEYLGLDFNERFVSALRARGVPCRAVNILHAEPVRAEYSVMMGSLYQFFPFHQALVDKVLSCTNRFIICEPLKNHAGSKHWLVRTLAHALNNPGDGVKRYRFTPASFQEFLAPYETRIVTYEPGEVETVVVLRGDLEAGGEKGSPWPSVDMLRAEERT